MRRAASALALRLGTAAAGFGMTLGLARLLTPGEFGHFAAMLALATLAAAVAVFGQNIAILRAAALPDPGPAVSAAVGTVTAGGLGVVGILGLAGAGLCLAALPDAAAVAFGAAALTLPLAWSEAGLAAAQASGRLWAALGPRDILWRCALAVAGAGLMGRWAPPALLLVVLAAVLLGLLVAGQLWLATLVLPSALLRPRWRPGASAAGRMTGAVAGLASANLSVLVLGATLGPAAAGGFFAAQRIAQVAALPSLAASTARARSLAVAHATEDRPGMADVLARTRRATIPATVLLGGAVMLGADPLLGLFGVPAGTMTGPLRILTATAMLAGLSGPTGQLMILCGGHRPLTIQTAVIQGAGFAALPAAIAWHGATGAALALLAAGAAANLAAILWVRRTLGVDPVIGALLSRPDQPAQAGPAAAGHLRQPEEGLAPGDRLAAGAGL